MLGRASTSLEIVDLPIVPADMRATSLFTSMKRALSLPAPLPSLHRLLKVRKGSGWELLWRLARLNKAVFSAEILLAALSAVLYYGPVFFVQKLLKYLENDQGRDDRRWGWFWVWALFATTFFSHLGS